MSWYLTIRSDASYSRFTDTELLVEFLARLPELQQSSAIAFEAAAGQPWVSVILAVCDSAGCYTCDERFLPLINVVELICSNSGDSAWYDSLAGRIAGFLGWSALEDNESRQIWP
jgi:hypothetical protein